MRDAGYAPRQRRQRPLSPGDRRQPTAKRQGLSRLQVDELYRRQGGRCALCQRPIGPDAHVDHDHQLAAQHGHSANTGCGACVRGLLCAGWSGCNRWLSSFRDDPAFLLRAAKYAASRRTG